MTLVAVSACVRCPSCDRPATRIHSRYWRRLADLPIHGVPVVFRVHARRFFCRAPDCPRKIFAERLDGVADARARRTRRLRANLRDVALADGGEAGARLGQRLGMPASPDTLLRLIRQTTPCEEPTRRVIGVDDWAKRKGRTYGAILIDLERHEVIDLLEEATAEAFRDWLVAHPGVEVISRDRGGVFAEGARQGAPQAKQVAHRWHLLKNLGDAIEEFLRRIHRHLPPKEACAELVPVSQSAPTPYGPKYEAERQRRRARRLERYEAVLALHRRGLSARRIAAALQINRETVQKYVRADGFPEQAPRSKRPSLLDPHRAYLEARWAEGCRNGRQLLRELHERGFRGKRAIVAAAVTKLRQRESQPDAEVVREVTGTSPTGRWSPRRVRWWFVGDHVELEVDHRSALDRFLAERADARTVYELAQEFGRIVRERRLDDLAAWLDRARQGPRELRSFAGGIERDRAAVEAALTEAWSQGQVEGQVHKLKLVRRKMFGRGKIDLLRRRLLDAG